MWKRPKSDLSDLERGPLKRFNQTCLLTVHLYPSLAALWQNREKVTEWFWSKWPPNAKRANFDLFDLEKWPLERFNQIYLSICDLCHPKEASCQKKKKSYWSVSEIDPSPPPLNLDGRTDGRTDIHVRYSVSWIHDVYYVMNLLITINVL